jgi:hypothetical protein
MARLSRAESFDPSEIAAIHVMARTKRRCFLLGDDQLTGMNFDHRKRWIEDKLKQLAANFGIDLLAFSCLIRIIRVRPCLRPFGRCQAPVLLCPGGTNGTESWIRGRQAR